MNRLIKKKVYPIGTRFKTRGKHPRNAVVTDILRTYNHKNELVKIRYVAVYNFAGQQITDVDVVRTTIDLGLIKD